MSNRIDDEFSRKNNGVVVPKIWVAVALSILIHIAAFWELPPISVNLPGNIDGPGERPRLSINLVPPAPPTPSAPAIRPAPPQPPPQPAPRAPQPKPAPRPQAPPAPPVIAMKKPKAAAPSPTPAPATPPPVPAPKPTPPAIAGDMESYIAARRAARGAPPTPPPVNEADERSKSIVANNLDSVNNRTFGYDPRQGGGVFQIERLAYDHAEFIFYGWNKEIRRNTKQLIDVRKGDNSDIRIAVVRKMVAIIREYEQEDFLWVSQRLGRSLMLSARPKDRAGLEAFMMQEFFPEFERMQ